MTFSRVNTPFSRMWDKFAKSKTARAQFVAGYVKRSIPAQIRHLMKQQGLTQSKLAQQAGLSQGVISRAADPNYGDLTLNTLVRIAAGFDCAFVGRYVPFSEFLEDVDKQIDVDVPTFEEENKDSEREQEAGKAPAQDILEALRKSLGSEPGKKLDHNRLQQLKEKKDAA